MLYFLFHSCMFVLEIMSYYLFFFMIFHLWIVMYLHISTWLDLFSNDCKSCFFNLKKTRQKNDLETFGKDTDEGLSLFYLIEIIIGLPKWLSFLMLLLQVVLLFLFANEYQCLLKKYFQLCELNEINRNTR